MNSAELKKMIKEAVREVLNEDSVIKNLVSESLSTSISTVFKVISENKDMFVTKEIIRESVIPQQINQVPTKQNLDDQVHLKFRAQLAGKQLPGIQQAAFSGIKAPNPQQVMAEQRQQKQAVQTESKQTIQHKGVRPDYASLISDVEFEDDEFHEV